MLINTVRKCLEKKKRKTKRVIIIEINTDYYFKKALITATTMGKKNSDNIESLFGQMNFCFVNQMKMMQNVTQFAPSSCGYCITRLFATRTPGRKRASMQFQFNRTHFNMF